MHLVNFGGGGSGLFTLPIFAVRVRQRKCPQSFLQGIFPAWESLHDMPISTKSCVQLSQFLFPAPPTSFRRLDFRRVFRRGRQKKSFLPPVHFDSFWPMIMSVENHLE